jgi:hypothetical protein
VSTVAQLGPPVADGVELSFPFTGRWRVRNSPARRVPSHGSDLFGERYAIDFVAVNERHRTADVRDWRTILATEPPQRFVGFGRPILAPAAGTVAAVHDGEPDHDGRRSQLALVPYMLGQAGRLARGVEAVAGNYVVIALPGAQMFVAVAHLEAESVRVSVGQRVAAGEHIADCGNSGNSTQPHVHMQLMDRMDLTSAQGIPMIFPRFREWPGGGAEPRIQDRAVPAEGAVVEPLGA